MRLWEGVDLDAVKASWVHGLGTVYERTPQAIVYALDNLPDDPPNIAQFRKLCNARPADPIPALPAPAADPERVAAAVAAIVKPEPKAEPAAKVCADRLRAMVASGRRLTLAQRAMLTVCEARMGGNTDAGLYVGTFSPVPPDALPPGMRTRATEVPA